MTSPFLQAYIDAADAVYSRNTSSSALITSLIINGQLVKSQSDGDGFYAQAYTDKFGNIIIAFEGTTTIIGDIYSSATLLDDATILQGQSPVVLQDAIDFAEKVHNYVPSAPIYVTGHSLGGAEAQAVATNVKTANFISGGAIFGSPGLPGYYGPTGQANFIDYVDFGDPVGNYAHDSASALSRALTGNHYGTVMLVGSSGDATNLQAANAGLFSFVEALPMLEVQLPHHYRTQYWHDLTSPTSGTSQEDPNAYVSILSKIAAVAASQPPSSGTTNPHPIITGPSTISAVTNNGLIPLSSLFVATETPTGSSHQIDHYSVIFVRGPGNIVLDNQPHSAGSVLTNIPKAEFATAAFSAGADAGVSEIAVVAFDDAGTSSNTVDATITVTSPVAAPQPINPNDHTPPTIVPPSQQLVTGVGSNPDLTPAFLQVTDANSANYTSAQLAYTIVSAPSHGYLLKGGSIVSSFTQSDINNGLLEYQENGTLASSDSFTYYVSDPAGNHSPNATFNISINAPPSSTHPTIDTNSSLSVGQNQTALITNSNLHVTDTGLNAWQIIYAVTGGATHGQILADGVNSVSSFTQQQVDLGLISYSNTGNSTGPDNFTFTVSDSAGGSIGQTMFDVNVIPKNNLHVDVARPLYTDPNGQFSLHSSSDGGIPIGSTGFTTFTNTPGYVTLLTADILATVDPGVDPANITYTVLSIPTNAAGFLIGHWGAPETVSFTPFIGRDFGPSDISNGFPHSFTQAEVDAGQVFYRQFQTGMMNGQEHYGDQFSIVLSVTDNVGDSLPNVVLPMVLDAKGLLTNGTFVPQGQIPTPTMTAPIGEMTTVGNGLLTYISPQFSDPQIKYTVWYTPQHGSLLLNGAALATSATFTQEDIDQGNLGYSENGTAVTSDIFGLFVTDPNQPSSAEMAFSVSLAMTGTIGGQVLTGQPGAETLSTGIGNNFFFGDGSTTVSYANSPNGVFVDLPHDTAANGYGGTDTITNVHQIELSVHDDKIVGGPGDTVLYSGSSTQYQITHFDDGTKQIHDLRPGSPDGTDTLTGIEFLKFSGGSLDMTGEHGILIQNSTTHQLDFLHSGYAALKESATTTTDGLWPLVAQADFNFDGQRDLVLQQDGHIDFAFMKGHDLVGSQLVTGSFWDIKGVGSFTGLGSSILVSQEAGTGQIDLLGFHGTTLVNSFQLGGNYWKVVGAGDFNGDGQTDIVTQKDGQIDFLFFQGIKLVGSVLLPGTYWDVHGVEDMNHDGHPDLITQHGPTGQIDHLLFNGTTLIGSLLENTAVPGWDVVNASQVADQFWHI